MKISYLEIPVTDMHRAVAFYAHAFSVEPKVLDLGAVQMALLTDQITLVQYPAAYIPSNPAGVLAYFFTDDMNAALHRISEAGGKVLREKTQVNESFGFMALFEDSEGNRLALQSKE